MSTLEKFGILVILILVVIIGVVAVWGVGGNGEASPFETTPPSDPVAQVPSPSDAGAAPKTPDWPGAPGSASLGAVPPPAVKDLPTPAAGPDATAKVPSPMPPAPEEGTTTYTIQKGDTLALIAQRLLGSRNRWQEIVKVNPGLDPRRLKVASVIRIPPGVAVASVPAPSPSPRAPVHSFAPPNPDDGPTNPVPPAPPAGDGMAAAAEPPSGFREVEVRTGDTFYAIAKRELGDANLYGRILAANPGLDPKRLRPGMRIKVPAAE